MKRFLIILLSFIFLQNGAFAIQDNSYMPSVAIMTDHILDPPLVYYNYPASSELFANEFLNELRLRKNLRLISASDVKEVLSLSTLTPQIKSFETQYRLNYIIDFSKLRDFAKILGADNILLVTSNIDPQSYILKGTIWNALNVSGVDVVNPVHQIVTNVALIDVKNETIIWQNLYRKNLKARDFSIIASSFAPNNQQLKAVSDYSKTLSHQVANSVEEHLCPYLYYDSLGNRYNRKSNSIIGKTKYYTKSTYNQYLGIDVPGAPLKDRYEKRKEMRARNAALKKEAAQEQLQTNNIKPSSSQKNSDFEEMQYEQFEVINPNPMRDYYQKDSLELHPSRTPNAYGNNVDDL